MIDRLGRNINYLRISVTDRCNLRCVYCMPEKNINFMPKENILTNEEIYIITKAVSEAGILKVRITGGEPLVREGIVSLIKDIKSLPNIKEICITTNGILLEKYLDLLINAGLDGINISLDTFKKDLYRKITRVGDLESVLKSIDLCIKKRLKVKLNAVIIEGYNDEEIMDFVNYTEDKPVDVRFIELMPIGQGKNFHAISAEQIKSIILKNKNLIPCNNKKNQEGPAAYFKTEKALGNVGFISAISNCFCGSCNRIRLTAEGFLKQCLYWNYGIDLRKVIREGVSEEKLKNIIENTIYNKPDKHNFIENNDNDDNRLMYQIGG